MRATAAVLLALLTVICRAERIILIPLDNRPAAGQFAQMIARMASVEVIQPPYQTLGRFTQPGSPEAILNWLDRQDFSDVAAVVFSTDMIAYGSLIASRTNDVDLERAMSRLRLLAAIRGKNPKVPFYGFSAVMRLAPTATRATAAWRLQLAKYAEVKERYRQTKSAQNAQSLRNLITKIPPLEIQRYEETRARNHQVQLNLVYMVSQKVFDYLIFGQDDAQPFGPHIPETQRLRQRVADLGVAAQVYFAEGIDQHANVLISRAMLRANKWTPRIRIVYSDDLGRSKIADYESKTVEQSVRDQILASGARPALQGGDYDFSLYLNTPGRREESFKLFREALGSEIDQGFPVAVADIDLAKDGTADPQLFDLLQQNGRMMKVLSYAGWNTAGNTMGTSIPTANVYLLARRLGRDPLKRELAQREFLLHRYVNDFEYHKYTRPQAYRMIDSYERASREETYGEEFDAINSFVRDDLEKRLADTFNEQFLGKRFFAGPKEYQVDAISSVKVFLPWPRAYEVRLEFRMSAKPTNTGG